MSDPKKKMDKTSVEQKPKLSFIKGSQSPLMGEHVKKLSTINPEEFEVVEQFEYDQVDFKQSEKIKQGEEFTRIRVVKKNDEVLGVTEEEVKEIIADKKHDIKKIIIEQVRHKAGDRFSLIVSEKKLGNSEKSQNPSTNKNDSAELPVLKLREIGGDASKVTSRDLAIHSKDELATIDYRINQWFYEETVSSEVPDANNDNNREENRTLAHGTSHDLVPKDQYIYKKQILVKKANRKSSKYFYQVKNHIDLFNVGQKFMDDYKNGIRHFAIYGEKLQEDREKTIFGLYAFFNYESENKVTIFTNNMDGAFYYRQIDDFKLEKRFLNDEGLCINVYTSDNLEVIEFGSLLKIMKELKNTTLEEFFETHLENSKLIFWDLPDIETMNKDRELFFPVIRQIENVSILVAENKSKTANLLDTLSYFKKYGVPIKGLLMAKVREEEKGHDLSSLLDKVKKALEIIDPRNKFAKNTKKDKEDKEDKKNTNNGKVA